MSKSQLRQFLVARQQLQDPALENPREVVRTLECIQLDPVALIGRNQDLVLGARLQQPTSGILDGLLSQGDLIEYEANAASIMPIEDVLWMKGIQVRMRHALQAQLDSLGAVVDDVMGRLAREGPLPASAFTSPERVTGYWDSEAVTKATSHALNLLRDVGVIRVVARKGGQRFFDLMERGIKRSLLDDWHAITVEEADRGLLQKYLRAYAIVDARDPRFGWQRQRAADRKRQIEQLVHTRLLTPLTIEGVAQPYYVITESLDLLEQFRGACEPPAESAPIRFLPPLDNLLWRRERLEDIFDYTYRWEIYTPESKRKYGAYVMPILAGSTLVGRFNARCVRETDTLQVIGIWWEPWFKPTRTFRDQLLAALANFSRQLGMRQFDLLLPLA